MHFAAQDLARTWVAPRPDALWETLLSVHWLQLGRHRPTGGQVPQDITAWRRQASLDLSSQPEFSRLVRARLVPLMPISSYFPDFLTPAIDGLLGADAGIETVLSTPRRRIREELDLMSTRSATPSWATALADGKATALRDLGSIMRSYFSLALAPYWPDIQAQIGSEHAIRARIEALAGVEAVLASLRPFARWNAAERVLEAPYPMDWDIRLGGRGLILIPSWFCFAAPVALVDPEQQPVLVYPIDHPLPRPTASSAALAQLIGPTRAKILAEITIATSTDAILNRVRMSRASVSRHGAALGDSGLVTAARHGPSVYYTRTALGDALIASTTNRARR